MQALFPNAVTETIGADGKPRQEIDAAVVERYQFTWPDKTQSVLRACAPISKTLRLDRAKSVEGRNIDGNCQAAAAFCRFPRQRNGR